MRNEDNAIRAILSKMESFAEDLMDADNSVGLEILQALEDFDEEFCEENYDEEENKAIIRAATRNAQR